MEGDRTFQLIMRRGPQPGEITSLTKQVMILGRDGRHDIVINDPEVSRQHARLLLQPEGYLLEDMGSTNGTFLNGVRLAQPRLLSDGDEIGLGETVVLVFQSFVSEAIETVLAPNATGEPSPAPTEAAIPPPPFDISSASEPAFPPAIDTPFPAEPEPVAPTSEPLPPTPTFSSLPEAPPPPLPQFTPEPTPIPARPVTTATPVAPPAYVPEEEEKQPDKRKRLLIGCGCLLLLVICSVGAYLAYTLGTAIWDAPPEFWNDPINNWDLLFGLIRPLLTL
jgi:pSer/pThr/pTyr-binding forkhead associated (FHA) protein